MLYVLSDHVMTDIRMSMCDWSSFFITCNHVTLALKYLLVIRYQVGFTVNNSSACSFLAIKYINQILLY